MKMNLELIRHYLKTLTMGRGVNAPEPMADLANFNGDIRAMHNAARGDGNLDWLRLSMDALIANPSGRIGAFAGQQFPFSEAELVELFTYAFGRIWPDTALSEPGDEMDLDFQPMSPEDWAILTGQSV